MAKVCNGFMFGTTAILGIVVESQNADANPQYAAEAKNDDGETIAVQLGKRQGTATVSGYKLSITPVPAVGSTFPLNGETFFIDKVTVQESNTDFQKLEITGKFWEGVAGIC